MEHALSIRALRRRKLRAAEWDILQFPEMIHGVPKPVSLKQQEKIQIFVTVQTYNYR